MLTRYPERFGALFCTIPLIDMRRYSKLLAGASWIAEYGDPDKPEDWALLRTYSAYHAAEPGRPYPPILFATTRRDDRVHPGHARKMAAKLQAMGYAKPISTSRRRRPRLRQGQPRARALHRAGLRLPAQEHRLDRQVLRATVAAPAVISRLPPVRLMILSARGLETRPRARLATSA